MKLRYFLIFFCFIILLVLIIYIINPQIESFLIERKASLENEIETLKSEFVFISFFVNSKREELVDFTLTIYGIDGSTVDRQRLVMDGNDIFIESKVITTKNNKAIVFPIKVFSDIIPSKEGKSLVPFYEKDEFPAIYTGVETKISNFIKDLFDFYVLEKNISLKRYGLELKNMDVVVHQLSRNVEENKEYECLIHPDGSIELREKNE